LARRRKVFVLLLVHCAFPFLGPIYKAILSVMRKVRNGSTSAVRYPNRNDGRELPLDHADANVRIRMSFAVRHGVGVAVHVCDRHQNRAIGSPE
jgi:hypothetical protein